MRVRAYETKPCQWCGRAFGPATGGGVRRRYRWKEFDQRNCCSDFCQARADVLNESVARLDALLRPRVPSSIAYAKRQERLQLSRDARSRAISLRYRR